MYGPKCDERDERHVLIAIWVSLVCVCIVAVGLACGAVWFLAHLRIDWIN